MGKGTKVIMNDNYFVAEENKERVFEVVSEPFDVCGTECVMLRDYSGAYALDGLSEV